MKYRIVETRYGETASFKIQERDSIFKKWSDSALCNLMNHFSTLADAKKNIPPTPKIVIHKV